MRMTSSYCTSRNVLIAVVSAALLAAFEAQLQFLVGQACAYKVGQLKILALRDKARQALGDRFIAVEIDSSKGNPHDIPRAAHSVLTEHFVDEPGHPTRAALDRVLDFFRTQLVG